MVIGCHEVRSLSMWDMRMEMTPIPSLEPLMEEWGNGTFIFSEKQSKYNNIPILFFFF